MQKMDLPLIEKNKKELITININSLGIALFVLNVSLLHTFVSSRFIFIAGMIISISFLILGKVISGYSVTITTVDIFWFLFLCLFIINILLKSQLNRFMLIELIVFTVAVIFLLLSKTRVFNFRSSLIVIKYLGVIYALGVLFQYYFESYYMAYTYKLFPISDQEAITRLMNNHAYSGLTNQTAHTAGYLINSLGVLFFSNFKKRNKFKLISFLLFGLLIFALLLTARRSHLIFFVISVIIVLFLSVENKKAIQSLIKSLTIISMFILIIFGVVTYSNESQTDNPFIGIFNKITITITGIQSGEDISSGRFTLYNSAIEIFKENPITGIGWSEFRNSHSFGVIRTDILSHPHNIYIQLLTELGILGFVLFIIPVTLTYILTFLELRKIIASSSIKREKNKENLIKLSLFGQTFFLIYGITENALTDHNFLMMYFVFCAMAFSVILENRNNKSLGLSKS